MITLVPNIYLLEYLKGTGKVEPKLEDQVKNRSIQALIQILL
jgi:hypothetical protein